MSDLKIERPIVFKCGVSTMVLSEKANEARIELVKMLIGKLIEQEVEKTKSND